MGWGTAFSWLISIVVLVAIIWFFSKMTTMNQEKSNLPTKSALDILNERYAKGEIDKNEYEQMKGNIQ